MNEVNRCLGPAEIEKLEKTRAVALEKAKNNNKMEQGISYEECMSRFYSVIICFGNLKVTSGGKLIPDFDGWDYFTSIYDEIPQEHRLKILLLGIYTGYHYRGKEFYQYLKKTLDNETGRQREIRMRENKKILEKYLDKENFVTLYRGVHDNSLDEEYALSYTVSKLKAEWFANRFDCEFKEVISEDIPLWQILLYTNDREEEEVIIIPECLENLEEYFDM